MKRLYVVYVGALASAILFAWLLPASTAAQNPAPAGSKETANSWTPSRTTWGDPDLQGVWRYEATMPLERPRELVENDLRQGLVTPERAKADYGFEER